MQTKMWKGATTGAAPSALLFCFFGLVVASSFAGASKTGAWLGMYDFDFPLREANDVLWSALRSCLVANGADPDHLPGVPIDRESDMAGVWTDPDLYLAQTCGYPYVTLLKEKGVRVVATPIYDAPFCESTDHHYRSVVVVRKDSPHQSLEGLRGLRAAVNSLDSNSGMNTFRHLLAQLVHQKNESDASGQASFFSEVKLSGGHLRSVAMVAEGEVDVAAIDCVTFSLLEDMRPNLPVRVLAKTEASPGLPLITSARTSAGDVAVLQSCLVEIFSRHDDEDDADFNVLEWQLPGAPAEPRNDEDGAAARTRDKLKRAKEVLRIKGIKTWANDGEADRAYQKILDLEDEAKAMNYPELK